MFKEGIGHGVYALPDEVRDDMFLSALNNSKIIFSNDTALFLNGLANRTPFIHSVTIPKNAGLSPTVRDRCVCFYVKPELHLQSYAGYAGKDLTLPADHAEKLNVQSKIQRHLEVLL